MKTPKLYFDTSVFNFAIADDVFAEREITLRLFEEVKSGKYNVFISQIVMLEINKAPEPKAIQLITKY